MFAGLVGIRRFCVTTDIASCCLGAIERVDMTGAAVAVTGGDSASSRHPVMLL